MGTGMATGAGHGVRPLILKPGEGEQGWLLGDHGVSKLGAKDTAGAFHAFVNTSQSGGGPPPHVHSREDEMFFVLDGTFSFFLDGKTYRGGPGSCVFLPKGIPHTFKNVGDRPGSFLGFTSPCGFEQFVAAVATTTPPTSKEIDPAVIRRLLELAPEFGIDMNPKLSAPPTDAGDCPAGDCRWVLGESVTIKQTAATTGGTFTVAEIQSWPGGGPPAHVHRDQDEMFYVLEGTYEFLVGDRKETLGVGATVFVPRGTKHTYRKVGDGIGRLFDLHTPGGFEAFFEDAGVAATDRIARPPIEEKLPDRATMLTLLNRHGMDLAG
jgi:mannose-6-phosphate isomerase-like protein (cupin superfamily)